LAAGLLSGACEAPSEGIIDPGHHDSPFERQLWDLWPGLLRGEQLNQQFVALAEQFGKVAALQLGIGPSAFFSNSIDLISCSLCTGSIPRP